MIDQPEGAPAPRLARTTTRTKPKVAKLTKKATVEELRGGLAALGLETKGKKETLWRRLYGAITRSTLAGPTASISPTEPEVRRGTTPRATQKIRSFLCFDVEATCRPGRGDWDYPNEIIEFPVVLLQWTDDTRTKLEKVDTFHSYVRPTWRPKLTEFCTSLTGITQETVDAAPTFPEVLVKLESWLDRHDLKFEDELRDAVWVTDGPWDLRDFVRIYLGAGSPQLIASQVPKQLHISPPSPPRHPAYLSGQYLNIKQAVQTYLAETWRREQYAMEHPNDQPNARAQSRITTAMLLKRSTGTDKPKGPNFHLNITGQVEALGLGDFKGRQHSGIDVSFFRDEIRGDSPHRTRAELPDQWLSQDATNISRILIALADRDVLIEANAKLPHPKNAKRYPWMAGPGVIKWEDWMSVPRMSALDSIESQKEEGSGDPETEWQIVEDPGGRMRAVKLPVGEVITENREEVLGFIVNATSSAKKGTMSEAPASPSSLMVDNLKPNRLEIPA